MASFGAFLLVYVIGGLTFVPICLAAALYLAVLACPLRLGDPDDAHAHDELHDAAPADLPQELKARMTEPDVAAAYFAVCREYVPGGVNGKPPERTTPAGTVVGVESPSVYQSMYRSIFERNRAQSPSMEGAKNAKAQKKARNVFFVVLRHGHLILFDDSEQVEVRYVISLAHRIVDVYAGGDAIPEGELWIKRNCIRLRRAHHAADSESESRPFYLFSDNCSEKEDFYFALLRNQERQTGMPISPPLQFEQPHVVKLVQQLHASEENLQTRWINALAGRLFLALYKTPNVEEFIRLKITKKIARVTKPAFIQSINIQRILMGDSAPMITNPKLRELTLDGDLTAEADIKYNGSFRLEIAAVARIDLGSRFKARHVNMVLAGILKRLEGHILIRVKPPPSNRLWITFEHPPKMDMTIEPIVSSRQITYGMILRTIENRIREVVAETLVLPNWDDMPFFDTIAQPLRGGIWEDAAKAPVPPDAAHDPALDDSLVDDGSKQHEEPAVSQFVRKDEKTMSMPNLGDAEVPSLKSRKTARSVVSVGAASDSATTSGVEVRGSPVKPKSMRSGSFASIARPVVAPDTAIVEAQKSPQKHQHDAIAAIKDLSSRSLPTSPAESPVGSPAAPAGPLTEGGESNQPSANKHAETETSDGKRERGPSFGKAEDDVGSITDLFGEVVHSHTEPISRPEPAAFSTNSEQSSLYSHNTDSSTAHSDLSAKSSLSSRKTSLSEKRQILNMSLNSATTAAKKWFASRQQHSGGPGSASTPGHASPSFPASSTPASGSGTPARPSSPTREQQQQQPQSLWSQSVHSEANLQQPNHQDHDRTPTTPLSSISVSTKPPAPSASPPKPQPQAENGPSRSSSISMPMGRGQPLPPPGVPLPPPAKPESKWVQGSAQLLGLAKRKSVPAPQSASSPALTPGNNGHGGNGNGIENHGGGSTNLSAPTDLQIPAATAAPAGMHGKDGGAGGREEQHQPPLARTRTTSSSGPAGGVGKERKGSEGGSLVDNKNHDHQQQQPLQEKEEDLPSTSHPPSPSSTTPPPPPLPPRKPAPVSADSAPGRSQSDVNVAAGGDKKDRTTGSGRGNGDSRRGRNHRIQDAGVEDGPQFLVIAAPAVGSDASAPVTPDAVDERGRAKGFDNEREEQDDDGDGDADAMAGSVFSLELDEAGVGAGAGAGAGAANTRNAAEVEPPRTPAGGARPTTATKDVNADTPGRTTPHPPAASPQPPPTPRTSALSPLPYSATSPSAGLSSNATPERSPNRMTGKAQGSGWFGGPRLSGGEPRHSGSVVRKAVAREGDGNGDG